MGAQGTTTIDFGAFPGKSDASVTITGQAGILAGSLVEVWLRPADTADHLADEHMVETIKVVAGTIVAGTGFTAYAFNTSQLNEPMEWAHPTRDTIVVTRGSNGADPSKGGQGTRIYGLWTIAWVWN